METNNTNNTNNLVLTGSTGSDSPPRNADVRLARYRRDLDRDIHAKRLRALARDLTDCPCKQVGLAMDAMQSAHADLKDATSFLRARRADWRQARRHWRRQEELAYKAVLFVAEELRKKPDRKWNGEVVEDPDQQERLDNLLDGQAPSLIRRDAGMLAEALRRLDRIFTTDDAEASLWPKDFVDAVGPLADALDKAVADDELAKGAFEKALTRLRAARGWWNLAWVHAQRVVNRYVEHEGGDPRLLRAFRPVRYKAAGSPEPVEDPDGGDAVEDLAEPAEESGLSEEGG